MSLTCQRGSDADIEFLVSDSNVSLNRTELCGLMRPTARESSVSYLRMLEPFVENGDRDWKRKHET